MKLNIKSSTDKIFKKLESVSKYGVFIFVISILMVYAFFVVRISMLSNLEPSTSAYDEQISTIKKPRIDQNSVQKLQELEDNSVEVKSLFNEFRKNPFQE